MLTVIASYSLAGNVASDLDLACLTLSGGLSAVNVETGAAIERTGVGWFKLPLDRHDFCLVRESPMDK